MRIESLLPFRNSHDLLLANARSKRRPTRLGIIGVIAAMLCFFSFVASGQTNDIFRLGFTHQLFVEVNKNDVMAAARAWAQAFLQEGKIGVIFKPIVLNSLSEIRAALSGGNVEALQMTTAEFAQTRELISDDVILCAVTSGSITEKYLLLVNHKSNIKQLSDLKGRTLGMLSSTRASLAATWLDTLLLREGLEPAATFFGQVDTNPKVRNLLIPLFFGKLDACVATRKAFDTMVELNPQTGKQLEVLESSPPFVPTVFCFRKGYTSPLRNQILGELQRWDISPAGRQSLTIFQTDGLEKQSVSCLDSALELLWEHQRLLGETNVGITEHRQAIPSEGQSVKIRQR
jgi:ABC-type phosphate/phosphonate transport system substrate-binding protein